MCCYWCFHLILPLFYQVQLTFNSVNWEKKSQCWFWLLTNNLVLQNLYSHQLWYFHRQTAFTVRTLTVTLTTIFWLYIIVNACLKQSGFPPPPYRSLWWTFLFCHGGHQDVLMQLFLFCLPWTVPSALDVYKCSF